MTFHVNPETGEPGKCSAKKGNCPFGADEPHFESKAEARLHYETTQSQLVFQNQAKWVEGPLDPELEAYMVDGPFGRFLQHPLIQDMMPDATPGLVNRRYRHALAQLQLAEEKEDWDRVIFLHERPFRAEKLYELHCEGVELPAKIYTDVWIDSENIWQHMEEWRDMLSDLKFRGERLGESIEELPETLTVYRGGIKKNQGGFSWTLDRDKAVWFAQRFLRPGQRGIVTEATVTKDQIVGYLTSRNESEIVVDPDELDAVLETAKESVPVDARRKE